MSEADFPYTNIFVQYCPVLHSTVQYCTVLYSTVQYCTVLFIVYDKKNQKRAAECELGEARF